MDNQTTFQVERQNYSPPKGCQKLLYRRFPTLKVMLGTRLGGYFPRYLMSCYLLYRLTESVLVIVAEL